MKNKFDSNEIKEWGQFQLAEERMIGKKFSISDYIKALIYAQLSVQRKWADIEGKLPKIDEIFHHYEISDVKKISKNPEQIVKSITDNSAGNRSIKAQMMALSNNLNILEKIHTGIEKDYTAKSDMKEKLEKAEKYIKCISKSRSKYKLKQIGKALAGEFLKNIGIHSVKSDVHILRILGNERLGILSTGNNKLSKKYS